MRRDLHVVPDGREPLDEIAGRHHVDAQLPDALDRARIHAGDVRDRPVRRVFHRQATLALEQPAELSLELEASRVAGGRPGQVREGPRFDLVNQPARLTVCRDEVVPAARGQVAALARDPRDVGGNRIQAAEVVEQPAVEPLGLKGRLDG